MIAKVSKAVLGGVIFWAALKEIRNAKIPAMQGVIRRVYSLVPKSRTAVFSSHKNPRGAI